jgi:NAD(P)-dependent dehydrogenase (short-subunit alcohol dehydrogenase family)
MTRQLALEGAPHGIRCNSISPGPISMMPDLLRQAPTLATSSWPVRAGGRRERACPLHHSGDNDAHSCAVVVQKPP